MSILPIRGRAELRVRKHPYRLLPVHCSQQSNRLLGLAQHLANEHHVSRIVFDQEDDTVFR
jgi:hypothetical protein